MLKVYKTIGKYLTYSFDLKLGNRNVSIDFTGALSMPPTPGKYVTADTAIQEAIERHSMYNKRFTLLSKVDTNPAPVPPKPPTTATESIKEIEIHNPVTAEKDIQRGIVNAQGAKDYLVERIKGTTYSDYKNVAQILAAAKKYNIEFPDWVKWVERPQ